MTEPKKCANGCGATLQEADINNICESCRTMISEKLQFEILRMQASIKMKKKGWNRYL